MARESDFFFESRTTKLASLNCPYCRKISEYPLHWILREKKHKPPQSADNLEQERFRKAQSYMILLDDRVSCSNPRCRKSFEVSGIKTTAFLWGIVLCRHHCNPTEKLDQCPFLSPDEREKLGDPYLGSGMPPIGFNPPAEIGTQPRLQSITTRTHPEESDNTPCSSYVIQDIRLIYNRHSGFSTRQIAHQQPHLTRPWIKRGDCRSTLSKKCRFSSDIIPQRNGACVAKILFPQLISRFHPCHLLPTVWPWSSLMLPRNHILVCAEWAFPA